MLKHATINRTNRAQQALQLQRQLQKQVTEATSGDDQSLDSNNNSICFQDDNDDQSSILRTPSPSRHQQSTSLQQSPAGSSISFRTATSRLSSLSSLPTTPIKRSQLFNPSTNSMLAMSRRSPSRALFASAAAQPTQQESIIKVFAQTLSQDVEYITLHVNAQTKCQQIVKSLLKKFRLKHRDPNLFYLTFERWIRKEGLKCKSVMLLSEDACPMQLQQCCSNPPYNDIKFTLQMRPGELVRIYCSDVVPNARYKCLSLSAQTTVEETIELILHCLNLAPSIRPQQSTRNSGSPSSTGSTNSSNSSSSGIDSDLPTTNRHNISTSSASIMHQQLNSSSRTSSITSISSNSDLSTLSNSISEQYCLVVECQDSNYKRVLESDEYLVDVYQNLMQEAKEQQEQAMVSNDSDMSNGSINQTAADQWFFIKLKKRFESSNNPNINLQFTNPRQNVPLPPIPSSLLQLNNVNNLQNIVSTTQIEVKQNNTGSRSTSGTEAPVSSLASLPRIKIPEAGSTNDLIQEDKGNTKIKCPPPPALIVLPPITPRRRNLSNASSTFTSSASKTNGCMSNRRRYDPAQLEADLSRLNMKIEDDMMLRSNFIDVGPLHLTSQSLSIPPQIAKRESIVIDNSSSKL